MPEAPSACLRRIELPDPAATERLGRRLAAALRSGDVVLLSGDLGAGKTSLARAIIRARAGDPTLEVPSPTFTLVQSYETPGLAIAHFDLYRIGDPAELRELGFDEAIGAGAVIVEWPERAAAVMPADAITVSLSIAGTGRLAVLSGASGWAERVAAVSG